VYLNNGELKQAKERFEKALTIMKKIFGEDHPDVAAGYLNLGIVYRCMKQYNLAKEHLEKALMIQKRTELGEKNELTSEMYRNLATVYDSTGEVHKAKEFYEKAMDIAKQTCGQKHRLAIYHDLQRLHLPKD